MATTRELFERRAICYKNFKKLTEELVDVPLEDYNNVSFEEQKFINKFIRSFKITYMSYYGTHKYSSTNRMVKDSAEFVRTSIKQEKDGYFVNIVKEGSNNTFISVWFGKNGDSDEKIIRAKYESSTPATVDREDEEGNPYKDTYNKGSVITEVPMEYNGVHETISMIIDLFE